MKFAKRICTIALGSMAIGITGFASIDAQAASDTGTANATIVQAIGITAANTLEFGDILNGAANTVTVSPASVRSATDGTQLIGGTWQAASFNITGDGNRAYTITLPANGVVTLAGPGPDMAVNNFTHDAGGAPALTAGADSFNVGADLSVANGQIAGPYTGTFTVTVNY
jgi:hypothetical protein